MTAFRDKIFSLTPLIPTSFTFLFFHPTFVLYFPFYRFIPFLFLVLVCDTIPKHDMSVFLPPDWFI